MVPVVVVAAVALALALALAAEGARLAKSAPRLAPCTAVPPEPVPDVLDDRMISSLLCNLFMYIHVKSIRYSETK